MDLKGKCALITGGARGIGRGMALALAREGVNVVVSDIGGHAKNTPGYELSKTEQLEATAKEVADLGVTAVAIECDVTDSAQVSRLVDQTIERLGGLHILINNAGIIVAAPVLAMEEEQWDAVLNVNLKGVFLCCRAVLSHMIDQKINISSIAGKRGHGGVSAYGCSKAGVISLTQCLAEEVGRFNITVNAICPGYLETAMWTGCLTDAASAVLGVDRDEAFMEFVKRDTPLGRPQTLEDIGEGAVFLARADNITGISLNIAGGAEMI